MLKIVKLTLRLQYAVASEDLAVLIEAFRGRRKTME